MTSTRNRSLGICHWGGANLNTGINWLIDHNYTGNIKVYFGGQKKYPEFTPTVSTLTQLAKLQPYQTIFNKFQIITLVIYRPNTSSNEHWYHPITRKQQHHVRRHLKEEYQQFYALANYLLQLPQLQGKTVILQNWETDHVFQDRTGETQHILKWFNTRQKAIRQARNNNKKSKLTLLHSVEFNKLHGHTINKIIPNIYKLDTISYSFHEWDKINIKHATINLLIAKQLAPHIYKQSNYAKNRFPHIYIIHITTTIKH